MNNNVLHIETNNDLPDAHEKYQIVLKMKESEPNPAPDKSKRITKKQLKLIADTAEHYNKDKWYVNDLSKFLYGRYTCDLKTTEVDLLLKKLKEDKTIGQQIESLFSQS
jgi:hypothetical protein